MGYTIPSLPPPYTTSCYCIPPRKGGEIEKMIPSID